MVPSMPRLASLQTRERRPRSVDRPLKSRIEDGAREDANSGSTEACPSRTLRTRCSRSGSTRKASPRRNARCARCLAFRQAQRTSPVVDVRGGVAFPQRRPVPTAYVEPIEGTRQPPPVRDDAERAARRMKSPPGFVRCASPWSGAGRARRFSAL